MAFVHGVGIHDPGHHPFVGVDVGCRHVRLGTEGFDDLCGVASRQALELTVGQRGGVAHHASLGPAEGNVDQGAFPGHPGGHCRDLVEGDGHVETDAALARSARGVVQHSIAGEHFDLTVVPLDGDRHDDLLVRVAQDAVEPRVEIQLFGSEVEPVHHCLERVVLVENNVLVRQNDRLRGRTGRGHRAAYSLLGFGCGFRDATSASRA